MTRLACIVLLLVAACTANTTVSMNATEMAIDETSEDNFTPSMVFAPAPRTQPRIVEITTHVTEPGALIGPHIDGIEAHLEEPLIGLHRIPTAVEEKLEALSCDVPPLPSQSVLWNGNQTRDLKLPVMVGFFWGGETVVCDAVRLKLLIRCQWRDWPTTLENRGLAITSLLYAQPPFNPLFFLSPLYASLAYLQRVF